MITKQNIIPFINYLYQKKYNQVAPTELLNKWNLVPEQDINTQLQNLFTHWGYSPQQSQDTIKYFLQQQLPNKNNQINTVKNTIPKKTFNYSGLIFLLIFIPAVYIAYQYFLFINLKNVYAITNNVSVRNDSNIVIARMDLQNVNSTDVPSFDKLKAIDSKIYDRTIDSTNKTFQHRKVLVGNESFFDYLTNNKKNIAYVNVNFITDSKQEYEQYKTIFGQLNADDANQLDLKLRKVIVGSLQFASDLNNRYLMSSCKNTNKDFKKNYTAILKQEIIPNIRYVIIARLSDGYYYRFYGDLVENSFAKPKKIGTVLNPVADNECLMGDLYFKYNAIKKVYSIYNCKGESLNLQSEFDNQNRVSYFSLQQQETNFFQDLIDTIKNNLPKISI